MARSPPHAAQPQKALLSTRSPLPANKSIPVAFLISEGAVVIDFCGPWEVFERVSLPHRAYDALNLYTVAESAAPIRASGGLKIIPNYTIANAPAPKVIVIPAQSPASEKTKTWIREASKSTDVTMSVALAPLCSLTPACSPASLPQRITAPMPTLPRNTRIFRFTAELASLRLNFADPHLALAMFAVIGCRIDIPDAESDGMIQYCNLLVCILIHQVSASRAESKDRYFLAGLAKRAHRHLFGFSQGRARERQTGNKSSAILAKYIRIEQMFTHSAAAGLGI